VQSSLYWSGTTYEGDTGDAWYVDVYSGYVYYGGKSHYHYVWPVRGGN